MVIIYYSHWHQLSSRFFSPSSVVIAHFGDGSAAPQELRIVGVATNYQL